MLLNSEYYIYQSAADGNKSPPQMETKEKC